MAVITTSGSETIASWLSDFNSLSTAVGDVSTLTTDVTTDLVSAINSVKDDVVTLDLSPYLKNDSAFTKTSGNVIFNDNVQAIFGTGSDLKIYHDGANSIIGASNTHSIFLKNLTNNENYIQASPNGAVYLFYDGSGKLYTTVSGVNITGNLTASGNVSGVNLTASGDAIVTGVLTSNNNTQSMIVYGGTSGNGANIELYGGSHSTLANDINYDADQHNFRTQAGTATFTIDASGNATATGTVAGADINSTSDARLKENVETVTDALDKVMNMRGVYFNRIGETERKLGVIAQEVEKIIPEVVAENNDGTKSVSYGNIVGLLIEAIRELKLEIDQLK